MQVAYVKSKTKKQIWLEAKDETQKGKVLSQGHRQSLTFTRNSIQKANSQNPKTKAECSELETKAYLKKERERTIKAVFDELKISDL